jgi:hypothetical protein
LSRFPPWTVFEIPRQQSILHGGYQESTFSAILLSALTLDILGLIFKFSREIVKFPKSRDPGFPLVGDNSNEMDGKTLAHPVYHRIHSMWDRQANGGKLPADFTHGSRQKVHLQCSGCKHGCGRQHKWEARVNALTRRHSRTSCPLCHGGTGGFCACQSVANVPRLLGEWHPSNPPPETVAKSSHTKRLWVCLEGRGHPPDSTSCASRSTNNSGCPICGKERCKTPHHPLVSVGRPDLARDWHSTLNTKLPSDVTLGSRYRAWWNCSSNPHKPWPATVFNRALLGCGCPACAPVNRSSVGGLVL